jgi:hypothetical protein
MKKMSVTNFSTLFCTFLALGVAQNAVSQTETKSSAFFKNRTADVGAPSEQVDSPVPASRSVASESVDVLDTNQDVKLDLGNGTCVAIQFEVEPGRSVSCKEKVPVKYSVRQCANSGIVEKGEAEALPVCEGKYRLGLHFKTEKFPVYARLTFSRTASGRKGIGLKYRTESASVNESPMASMLKDADVQSLDGKVEDETPVEFSFGGFGALETQASRAYGFDGDSSAQDNFKGGVGHPNERNINFMANFEMGAKKDKAELNSVVEIGEIYFGDATDSSTNSYSGGAQGGRARIVEIRNIELRHNINDAWSVTGGLSAVVGDPRSFVFNDHIGAMQGSYKTDKNAFNVWYGESSTNRVGTDGSTDVYTGVNMEHSCGEDFKMSVYGIWRTLTGEELVDRSDNSVTAHGDYYWAGTTIDFMNVGPVAFQVTGIYNGGTYKSDDLAYRKHEAYLADAKITYSPEGGKFEASLEGLVTSGSKNSANANGDLVYEDRKSFISPVAAAYLFTVATSDGVDDSAGSPKESIIADLNQAEGLNIFALSATYNRDRMSATLRYGIINSAFNNETTDESDMGTETDLVLIYQASPSTTFQADFGVFTPGDFFENDKTASLAAGKMKFTF